MQYYCDYGHNDFVLCLGYKSNTVKQFFLDYKPQNFADCVVTGREQKVELLQDLPPEWRVTMIDTGVWRNIGERLWAVRDMVKDDDIFLANYSDGLTDLDLDAMVTAFKASDKVGCFLAVRPPLTYHLTEIAGDGNVTGFRSSATSDIWINGGYFVFRREIFDYMREGEELVLEPFERLIAENKLMAWKHEGFWRAMDTLRDRQTLEDMVEQGRMPWRPQIERSGGSPMRPRAIR
jgi:glucose-1-phosphate cytidylyltransferase